MYELALFPLHTVLFPSSPLQLHIFEERYKQMIEDCISQQKPFGVVLIRRGAEAFGALADPFRIGCTAVIRDIQRLEDGRMNLTAIGKDRFRIISLDSQSYPYLIGMVEDYPVAEPSAGEIEPAVAGLRERFERYLSLLVEAGLIELDKDQLPREPMLLAYLSAALLQIPAIQKQQLLSLHDAPTLITRLIRIYNRELALTRLMIHGGGIQQGSFSVN